MVAGDDVRQSVHPALLIQRMDLGIGALVCNIFLNEQMTVGQSGDLCRMRDAEDLMILCALLEHLADAAGRLARNAAVAS